MKYFYIVASSLILSGCITEKKRLEICKSCTLKEAVTDSIGKPEIKETKFDSLLWIKNHVGKEQDFTNCDSLLAFLSRNNDTSITKKNGVKSVIIKSGNGIKFRCETDSLKEVIKLLRTELAVPHFKTIIKENIARCDKEHRNSFDGFCRWFLYIVAPLIGLFGVFKIYKLKQGKS